MSVLATVEPLPAHACPTVVGAVEVPLVTGDRVPYANLDYAASAPCLTEVRDAVDELLPYYASVHRGAGYLSQRCTRRYEDARASIRSFVGARDTAAVVITRNTTDALNLLAHALPRGTSVVVFETEHHAALLPWRAADKTGRLIRLPAPASPEAAVSALDAALQAAPVGPRLVCVTGASNVTGEVWPIAELTWVAHRHGARLALDAAQLAPHAPINAARLGVDYVALSGHKLYAPFGAGALIGRADWLRAAPPYLAGGGASRHVGDHNVTWADVPARHEAGTPNILGAVALAAACDAIAAQDHDALVEQEQVLLTRLRIGLAQVAGVRQLSLWGDDADRVGIVSFVLDGWDGQHLAAALAAEHGIGVRAGAFCAHPFVRHLTGGDANPVRVSIGIGTTAEHVTRFVGAVGELARNGARWTYVERDGEILPERDPRPAP